MHADISIVKIWTIWKKTQLNALKDRKLAQNQCRHLWWNFGASLAICIYTILCRIDAEITNDIKPATIENKDYN